MLEPVNLGFFINCPILQSIDSFSSIILHLCVELKLVKMQERHFLISLFLFL